MFTFKLIIAMSCAKFLLMINKTPPCKILHASLCLRVRGLVGFLVLDLGVPGVGGVALGGTGFILRRVSLSTTCSSTSWGGRSCLARGRFRSEREARS